MWLFAAAVSTAALTDTDTASVAMPVEEVAAVAAESLKEQTAAATVAAPAMTAAATAGGGLRHNAVGDRNCYSTLDPMVEHRLGDEQDNTSVFEHCFCTTLVHASNMSRLIGSIGGISGQG